MPRETSYLALWKMVVRDIRTFSSAPRTLLPKTVPTAKPIGRDDLNKLVDLVSYGTERAQKAEKEWEVGSALTTSCVSSPPPLRAHISSRSPPSYGLVSCTYDRVS
jgi:hypothetical protein